MIEKDLNRYLKWGKVGFETHHKIQTTFCKVGEIWYTKIGCNIGSEIDGKGGFIRPVVILKIVGSLIFICPLTSKTKTGDFYYKINDKNTAILSEAKYIDKKRLIKKINHIENTIIKEMKKAISRWKKLSRDYSFDSFFLNGGILLLRGSYY